jgi:hypothetical protein
VSDPLGAGEGASELAAPVAASPTAVGEGRGDDEIGRPPEDYDDELVRTKNRTVPSNVVLLLIAILVATIANVVVVWFVLGTSTQLRDQYTIANGFQRCLIQAQLNENSTTDPNGTAYKAAVTTCINK